ncbi:phosphoribosylformylglycinamidine cyclo-ligase [Ruminococcaceae bacterium OttesenSCG-928-L11]|nr:phosphoribosylformylglycinamidine cyclo-ligase [Ruminococcaceae bacterium OttesenSCG-928-L11]
MENSYSESYKAAGVDITAGYRAVELMKQHVERTRNAGVLDSIGGFGGLYALPQTGGSQPVLVSGTDGVGTKLQIALLMDKHDTIGIDCVAMCVNDIICTGARPLFFLDYLAMGKVVPEKVAQIVAGIAEGCVQSGCALVGGETAEHPGVMPEDDYDLAGFSVGLVDKSQIIDKSRVAPGDVLIGIASSGVHSNGFSLTRKVFDVTKEKLNTHCAELGKTLGEELLVPTRIYVRSILKLVSEVDVHSVGHITGGGFFENIPRALSNGNGAVIEKKKLAISPIFELIAKTGNIPERDMFNTYNMGVGMCVTVAASEADKAVRILNEAGETATVIGEVKAGVEGVELV